MLDDDVVSPRRCLVLAGRQNYTRHEVHSHVQTARPVAEAGAVHTEVDTHAGSNADATLETEGHSKKFGSAKPLRGSEPSQGVRKGLSRAQ